jgi:hypothetical protein
MLRRALRWCAVALVLLAAVLTANTLRRTSQQIVVPAAARAAIDERAVAERLARRAVSHDLL